MQKIKFKLILTGGHALATAYALISYMKKVEPDWETVWVGPKSHIEGKKVESLENETFKKLGVKILNINAGRIQRKFTFWTIPSLIKIPFGVLQAIWVLLKEKPQVVLSFGGFVGFPMVLSSWMLGIPVIVHEQTISAGRANIYASRFARKVAIARVESKKYFPEDKVIVTGNPVDSNILSIKPKIKIGMPPVIFATGGHTGSVLINAVIEKIIKVLLSEFVIIHQTGKLEFEKFQKIRAELPAKLSANYEVYPTISAEVWPSLLNRSDIVISRAGANIVSQLLVTKRPSILIPIAVSYNNEQLLNAQSAQKFGIGKVIEEKDFNKDSLLQAIYGLRRDWNNIAKKVHTRKSPDTDASENITRVIKNL